MEAIGSLGYRQFLIDYIYSRDKQPEKPCSKFQHNLSRDHTHILTIDAL